MLILLELNLHASARSVLEPRKYARVAVIMVLQSQGFFIVICSFTQFGFQNIDGFGLVFWTCSYLTFTCHSHHKTST